MRSPRALLVAFVLFAAGCAEAPGPDLGTKEPAARAAFDAPEEGGPNRTILVLRGEGVEADRLTYLADGSWLPRLAPGLAYPPEHLDVAFARATNERGGLVLRIEKGAISEDAREALEPFLEDEWPSSFEPPGEPHPWYRPLVFVRADPRAVAEAPDQGQEHLSPEQASLGELMDAVDAARTSFVASEVEDATLPIFAAWDGCLRASTSVEPEAATVGEPVTIRALLENCGDEELTLDPSRCSDPPGANVQISAALFPVLATLPASEEPEAAYAIDLVCRGDASPVTIPAGGSATLTRRWNGTIAACDGDGACAYRPAAAGEYSAVTFATGQTEAMPASVKLFPADAVTTRLLVVREYDWVNTTSTNEHIRGSFGPHCAPVSYTTEPATLSIWYYEEKPALASALIVRDWRAGERPNSTMTMSADRLDLVYTQNGSAALTSPFGETPRTLANVALEGDAFVVNGTRIEEGGVHVERFEEIHEQRGATFHTTSLLVFEHVGEARVLYQRAGGCA